MRKLIPQLEVLDDAPAEEEEPRCSSTMTEDWALLKESIKDTTSILDSTSDCLGLMGNLMNHLIHASTTCMQAQQAVVYLLVIYLLSGSNVLLKAK